MSTETAAEHRQERGRNPAPIDLALVRRFPVLGRHLAVCGVAAILFAVAILAQAEVLARGLTAVVGGGPGPSAASVGATLLVVAMVRGAVAAVIEWSAGRTLAELRLELVDLVFDAGAERVDVVDPHRAATIAIDGPDRLETWVRSYAPALTQALVVPVGAGIRILTADVLSAVVVAVTVPLIPVFMILIGQMTQRRADRSWATMRRLGHHFGDVLTGLPTLRLFGRARHQAPLVLEVAEHYRASTMATLRVAFLSALVLELVATLSVALVAVEVGLRLAAGRVDLPLALTVLLLVPECYLPLRQVGAGFHAAQDGLDATADARELESGPLRPAGSTQVAAPGEIAAAPPEIIARGVVIERDDQRLELGDRRFVAGEVAVITGVSGVGKSTLLDALRGRMPVTEGVIEWDGRPVGELSSVSLGAATTWIPQRPTGSARSVSEEVAGTTGADDAAVDSALGQVGLPEFGSRSMSTLSGGERRRVLVAHSMVAASTGARVVLADEPTAQLDAVAADLVIAALRSMADQGAIVITASHDPRLIAAADSAGSHAPADASAGSHAPADALAGLSPSSNGSRSPDPANTPARNATATPSSLRIDSADIGDESESGRAALTALARRFGLPRRRLGLAVGMGTLAELSALGLAGAAAWLILRASEQPQLADLALAVTAVRACGTGKAIFRYAERLASHDAGLTALAQLRAGLVEHLARVDPRRTTELGSSELVRRTVADVDRILDVMVRAVVPWSATAVTLSATVVFTVLINPLAGVLLGLCVGALALVGPLLTVKVDVPVERRAERASARQAATIESAMSEGELLIDRGWWEPVRQEVRQSVGTVNDWTRRRTWRRATTSAAGAALPLLTTAATLSLIDPTQFSRGIIGVLVLLPLAAGEVAATVTDGAEGVVRGTVAATRVNALWELPTEPDESHRPQRSVTGPALVVDDLIAQWTDAAPPVGPISIKGDRGERLLLTGPSGIGKSTFAAALVDYCPNGAARFDVVGTPRDELGGEELRRDVTWVDQQPWIADSSIAANLRIARPNATDDDLFEALRLVGLDAWVRKRRDGLNTLVGRNGAQMSGGEAHRLALARVALAGHETVVLDEPYSHLDEPTADLVADRLGTALHDRLIIELGHADTTEQTLSMRRGASRWVR